MSDPLLPRAAKANGLQRFLSRPGFTVRHAGYLIVTAAAVLIQTGIAAGLYYATWKMTREADKAVAQAQEMVGPVHL